MIYSESIHELYEQKKMSVLQGDIKLRCQAFKIDTLYNSKPRSHVCKSLNPLALGQRRFKSA